MLKILISSLLFSFVSLSAMASNCEISDSLKNKQCSDEFFRARNQKQLNDYLLNGSFRNGKLLALEVDFNIKDKEIQIATSCDLKINRGRSIFASLDGICLSGRNIFLEGGSHLFSDKKAPINLKATDSIKIRSSFLETKGNLDLLTSNFLPFRGEILISRGSVLGADKVTINAKSSLILNNESSLRSRNIILNGGNCEIGDNDDKENDDSREHARECRKFKPNFSYTGTCSSNPIPANLKVLSTPDSKDSKKITYSISGLSLDLYVNWKFDNRTDSIDKSPVKIFMFPGRHLVEAVVLGQNGFFRKIGSYSNVSPSKLNKGQVAIFQFVGLKKTHIKSWPR